MSPIFSSNSEAPASELPENLEEMFPLYYMHTNDFYTLNYSTHQHATRLKRVNIYHGTW